MAGSKPSPEGLAHGPRRSTLTGWIGRGLARLSYGYFIEPVWLEANRLELAFPDLDPALLGLRILHLTDFHMGSQVPATHVRQAIERARRESFDLVALTGDFVHSGFRHVPTIAQLVGRLKAPLGVYAVLGNHDYGVRRTVAVQRHRSRSLPAAVGRALEDVGVRVLHNEHVSIDRNGGTFAVAGVADLWSREADLPRALEGIDPSTPRIVLAHNPVCLEQLGGRRCDLMLSGHTHGGQVHVPGMGPAILSPKMRDFAAGLYRHESGYLYVNKGIGYTLRFRFKTRPEIAVLTFRPEKP